MILFAIIWFHSTYLKVFFYYENNDPLPSFWLRKIEIGSTDLTNNTKTQILINSNGRQSSTNENRNERLAFQIRKKFKTTRST